MMIITTLIIAAFSFADEAKPLAFPDFSAVAEDPGKYDHIGSDMVCVTSDGKEHRRGTEGFSECMNPGKVDQSGLNVAEEKKLKRKVSGKKKPPKINVRAGYSDGNQGFLMPVKIEED